MKVVLSGFGAMGKVLLEEISSNELIELSGVVDPLGSTGVKTFDKLVTVPDVIIDFSHPSVLDSMLEYSIKNRCNVVIATTGYDDLDEEKIKTASKEIAILKTGNTSLGVNLLLEVVKQVTEALDDSFDIEVIEKHHNKKIDAPSGTAKMFVDAIVNSREKDSTVLYGREGVSKRNKEDITVHAVRGGTITGEHTVIYAGNDELIEITHQAQSKRVFATGAVKAAIYMNKQEKGLYTMKDVLFK